MDRNQGRTLSDPASHWPIRAFGFWQHLGYVETGEVKLAEPGQVPVAVLEKPLQRTLRA